MAKQKPIIILAEGENIPLNQLRLSPENVRKIYADADVENMAADIRTNGLIQSLSVRKLEKPDGPVRAEVQGGGLRFRALRLLAKSKELADDALIPTVPNERQLAEQISLAENVQRKPMHPLDEFRAIAALLDKGMTEDAIADAQRLSVRTVRQRLRMANASPVILKAFEDDKMKLPTLMAFCITDNHERQETVWKQVKGGFMADWAIKEKLMEDTVPTSDKRVRYVTLAAYEKAGGHVERDLFDDRNQGYIQDIDLLNQLTLAKLERAAEKHKAEGWSFAIVAPTVPYAQTADFDQLTPSNAELTDEEQAHRDALEAECGQLEEIPTAELTKKQAKRLEEASAELEAIDNREPIYAAEDMARAGITLEIDSNGKLKIERGFVKPDDVATGTPAAKANGTSAGAEDDRSAKLADSLVNDLTQFRTASLQAALAGQPDVAFVATLHAMAMNAFTTASNDSCLQIRATTDFPHLAEGLKEFGPVKTMADQRKAWMAKLPRDSAQLWDAITAMARDEQMQLLAYLAAATVNVVVQKHDPRTRHVNHSQLLARALDFDIRKDWTPTADNFFKRVTKATMLAAVTEAVDAGKAELLAHANLKKAGMAAEAERLTKGTGWLPAPLQAATPTANAEDDFGDDLEEDEEAALPDFLQSGEAGTGAVAAA